MHYKGARYWEPLAQCVPEFFVSSSAVSYLKVFLKEHSEVFPGFFCNVHSVLSDTPGMDIAIGKLQAYILLTKFRKVY